MKIAIVSTISGLSWGGSEELWAAAARRALDRGHGVLASMGRAHQPPSPKLARLTTAGMGFVERRRSLLGRLDRAMAARGVPLRFGFLRSYKPDVVLVSQCAGYDLAQNADVNELRHWLLTSGTPFVVLVQWNAPVATIGEPLRPLARTYLEAAGAVLYVSERNMLDARRHLCSPLPRARVVRNPVNLTSLEAVPWPAAGGPPRLACIGRLDVAAKGQDVLLEAFAGSRLRSMGATLDIYGSGPHEGYIRETIARLGLQDQSALRGHTGDIRAVWADHHAICVPSHSEGTPLVLVEAMVCGRPSIVTDVGGNTEWVTEPNAGFIAPASTVEHYRAALDRAAADFERWPEIGTAARLEAQGKMDPDPGSTVVDVLEAVGRR